MRDGVRVHEPFQCPKWHAQHVRSLTVREVRFGARSSALSLQNRRRCGAGLRHRSIVESRTSAASSSNPVVIERIIDRRGQPLQPISSLALDVLRALAQRWNHKKRPERRKRSGRNQQCTTTTDETNIPHSHSRDRPDRPSVRARRDRPAPDPRGRRSWRCAATLHRPLVRRRNWPQGRRRC